MASGESRDVRRYKKILELASKPLAVTQQEVKKSSVGSEWGWHAQAYIITSSSRSQMKSGHGGER